jgi:hypothetical protein
VSHQTGLALIGVAHAGEGRIQMSLPATQRRKLHGIERQLRRSDRRLTALFGTFTRLTQDEDVPGMEQLTRTPLWRIAERAWVRTVIFCAIAAAALMCAVAIAGAGRGTHKCGPAPSQQRASQASPAGSCAWDPAQNPGP